MNHGFNHRAINYDSVVMIVIDSIVDIVFFIDIIFNFHTSFVGNSGEVVTDQKKIRRY
jgi:potassium voltage-gated channel Eag-related subfamily H protein 5